MDATLAQMPAADEDVPTFEMVEQPLADCIEMREILRSTVFAAEMRFRIARFAIAPAPLPTTPPILLQLLLLLDLAAHWAKCWR